MRPIHRLFIPIIMIFMLLDGLLQDNPVWGQSRSVNLADQPAVKKKLLYRKNRAELYLKTSFSLNDVFVHHIFLTFGLNYHITNYLYVGLDYNECVHTMKTRLRKDLEASEQAIDPNRKELTNISYIQRMGALHLGFAPFIGKFNLFRRLVVNYDLHILAGIAFAQIVREDKPLYEVNGVPIANIDTGKFAVGGVFGIGARLFLLNWFAIELELKDYLFMQNLNGGGTQSARISGATGDETIRNNIVLNFGVSFFFPFKLKYGD